LKVYDLSKYLDFYPKWLEKYRKTEKHFFLIMIIFIGLLQIVVGLGENLPCDLESLECKTSEELVDFLLQERYIDPPGLIFKK